MVEVSYTTTLDDYVAYAMHSMKRSPSIKWRLRLIWAFIPIVCWLWAALHYEETLPAAGLIIGGLLFACFYPLFHRSWSESTIREFAEDLGARGVIGPITLLLTDDSLTERTESVQSTARWQNMKGIEVVGECTYIHVTGLQAAIVPRHGFEHSEDYERVRDFALSKLTSTPLKEPGLGNTDLSTKS